MTPGIYELINGLCALIGALLIWEITGNIYGWGVLFLVGSGLVFLGLYRVLKSD